jgi:hypothetical protein
MELSGHEQHGPPVRSEFENWAMGFDAAVQHVIAPRLGAFNRPAPTARRRSVRGSAD